MKALSLRQPWAWLVVHGGKDIENRRWNTKFRGEFLIHAAKGVTRTEYMDAIAFAAIERGTTRAAVLAEVPVFEDLERGGIIGMATLGTIIHPLRPLEMKHRLRWHMPEQFGFVLHSVKALPFQPLKGALGFFDVEVVP